MNKPSLFELNAVASAASASSTTTQRQTKKLVRRGPKPMALEQRFMFDGAAVGDAVNLLADHAPGLLVNDIHVPVAPVLALAEAQVAQRLDVFLQQPASVAQLFQLFNGGQTEPSAKWQQNADALLAAVKNGSFSTALEIRSSTDLQGALGAFAAQGPAGKPVIYLNEQYLAGATADAAEALLLEELGHALDYALNGDADTVGDEGHAFAALLLTGDANQAAVASESDHSVLSLDGQAVAVENADAYNIAQIHFVPLPEQDVQTALTAIAGAGKVSGDIQTVIAISATSDSTVIVYDQWEDGYELDIKNPLQATTLIWGDGNIANGTAPGTTDDLIHAGQTVLLKNAVAPGTTATVFDFDGKDKIGSTKAVAVTKAGWSNVPGTVLAGAVSVIDAGNAGKEYVIPFGQNVDTVATGTNRLFEYTSLHIIATANGTVVNIDLDGNGVSETTVNLNQGQSYMVNGGVLAGARITANNGIGVYAIAGDIGSAYENRWFSITPREQWANSYYAPVGTTLAADPAYVIFYNPNATAIDVYYDTASTTGKITVPANVAGGTVGTNYFLMPASAAHFYTKDNSKFYAVSAIDADATSNATHDWSYSLVPETYLTTKFVVAWGPGNGNTPAANGLISGTNGSPVWITSTKDTTIRIESTTVTVKDSKGVVVVGDRVLNGLGVAQNIFEYDVKALESYRVFDTSDNDQSGLTVYTTDGTLITAAWGEDPSIAGAGTPYLDMGTTVLPFPDYVFSKNSAEAATAVYGAGVSNGNTQIELSEQIEYTISVTNRAVIDLYNINIKDAITPADGATYVAGSTTLKIVRADGTVLVDASIPDDAVGTSFFPLAKADGGYTITDTDPGTVAVDGLKRGDQVIIKYRVKVRDNVNAALAAAGFAITNDAEMTGDPAGTNTAIPAKLTTNTTLISVNGTADGQVFLKDAAYAASTATFEEGATVGIEVVDSDANLNAATRDTLTVTVTNTTTGETEAVLLTETTATSGVFRNTLATSITAGAGNSPGTLLMRRGDSIKVDYVDPLYGLGFDNPTNPGVAGDADNNIATGNANTAYASIPVPSQTKILYLSDDSAANLDRVLPPAADGTAASTALINASSGATAVRISDDFSSTTVGGGGSGWSASSSWTETGETDGYATGDIRVTGGTNGAIQIRGGNARGIERLFAAALSSSATLTFDLKDILKSSNTLGDAETITVKQYLYTNGNWVWTTVGVVTGAQITSTSNYSTISMTLANGAAGVRFMNDGNSTNDRVYIDNINIVAGYVSTASSAGATDYAISTVAPAGQTFSFSGSATSADAISIDSLSLSLKKTGTTAATATVSIRSAWDGTALWTGTVSTSVLTTTYQDKVLAVTGLTLDKNASYYIRVDSNASGIVWQGDTVDTPNSYTTGSRVNSAGVLLAGDMRFALAGKEALLSSVSFTQSLSMATDFSMPAGGVVKVVTYVTNSTGLVNGANANLTATLSANGVNFATASSADYSPAVGTPSDGTLTWTISLAGAKTVLAGQSIKMDISNAAVGKSFKIAYDSAATRSRIELPTTSVITLTDADSVTEGVQEIAFFDQSLANGGSPITSGFVNAGGLVYVRVKVADPFGDYDISSLVLNIDDGAGGASPIALSLDNAYVVDAANDGRIYKTYEYAWQTSYNIGSYTLGVTANEGSEGSVTDTANTTFLVTETDLGTPSGTMFLTNLTIAGGIQAGAVYDSGSRAYLRVTDLDNSGRGSVTATVAGFTVTLTETSSLGIFEADLGNSLVHTGDAATQALAAAYFTNMPAARALTASYEDWNDSTDISTDAIVVNSAPTALANAQSIGIDKQATGNVITDDNNGATAGGVDSDVDGQTLTVTAVNDVTASVGDTVTLASGARLFFKSDGSYIYDPGSLTSPPTSGAPVKTDSFTYTVSDGQGGTSTATVSLTINYVNPIVIDNQASTDGATVEFDISNKFADVTETVDVAYSATGLPSGLAIDINSGLITGTALANASTTAGSKIYTVAVIATELDPNTGQLTNTKTTRSFTWTFTNLAPVAVGDTAAVNEGLTTSGNVKANDADGSPDSDAIAVIGVKAGSAANAAAVGTANLATSLAGTYGHLTLASTGLYSYIADTAAANALVAGATATDTFSYAISDGSGGTAFATLVVTITGVNDAAVLGGDAVGAVTEDATTPNLTDTGALTISDADTGEAVYLTAPGDITASSGALGSLSITSAGVWTYTVANSSVQYLKAGETKTETFTVKSTDGTTKDVVVTITGVNDAAVLGGDAVGAVTEDATTPDLTDSGTLTISDADTGEAVYLTAPGDITASTGALGSLSITSAGIWTYTVANSNVQYLKAGESKTETFTVKSSDGTTKNVVVTITGVNDAAVLGGDAVGAVTEDATTPNLTDTGTLTISDADTGEAVYLTAPGDITASTGALGSLSITSAGIWTYSVPNADVQYLKAGETNTETFTVKSTDGTTKNVVVTITGVNDAAVLGGDAVGAVTEDATTPNLTDTGTLTISDADTGEAVYLTAPGDITASSGALGSLSITSAGVWTYTVANSSVQYLKAGETKIETFTVKSSDGTTKDVVVTITGVNDAAVLGGDAVGAVTEDTATPDLTDSGTLTISDADTGEAVYLTAPGDITASSGALGSLSITSAGIWTYSVPNADVQYLKAGETNTETFTVKSTDGTTKNVVVTITGVNDAAVLGGDAVGAVTEDATTPDLTDTGTLTISDADTGEAVYLTAPGDITASSGALGSLSITSAGVWTYTVANSSVQYLKAGETNTETFTVKSTDGTTKNVVVTITGVNEPAAFVSDVVVNEASPFAVFTVTTQAGIQIDLVLTAGTGTGLGGDFGAANTANLEVSTDGGQHWVAYLYSVTVPPSGSILVRTPVINDTLNEGPEGFQLRVTNADGIAATGSGIIMDDGTGSIFTPTGAIDPTATPSDDRPLTVTSSTVSESSPYAVFAVTGAPNQLVRLTLESGTATVGTDMGTALEYFDGSTWQAYIPGTLVAIPGTGTTLLVRTAIKNDTAFEGAESFQLKVSNSGGVAFAGTATIKDDGSSANVFEGNNATPTPTLGEANDDQSKPAPAVQEAAVPVSAAAPTPPAPLPVVPPRAAAEPFDSAVVVITPSRLQTTERPAVPLGEILTSVAGFRVVVAAADTPSLIVFRGITDQFVEGNKPAVFSLPADAFVHTKPDAVVTILAKLANGEDLPAWVQFDARSGTFKLDPPAGFNDELQIKVIARDNEGREAVSMFKFNVSLGKVKAKVSGRSSFSEQIAGAGRRSMPWLDQVGARESQAVQKVRG